jgi:transcriptional regulator with XRE-family HTH domain
MGARPQHSLAYRKLCRHLREWRHRAELTQRALGAKLRRPHSYVHKVETQNRRIDPVELAQWANACGVKSEEVLAAMGFRSGGSA